MTETCLGFLPFEFRNYFGFRDSNFEIIKINLMVYKLLYDLDRLVRLDG